MDSVVSMKRIATLGPPGTFSARATSQYIAAQNEPYEVEYFSSIGGALKAIGGSCEIGVLPIENFSEGFIPLVLDHLVNADLVIVGEVILPIKFSLVSTSSEISEINQLFVQFVAKGQCSQFIETLGEILIVTTESNMESLDRARCAAGNSAAIVPSNSFCSGVFTIVVENIHDYKNNQTRFLVFSGREVIAEDSGERDYKTSIIVLDDNDHPGLLGEILASFSKRKINLTSIISRPTCTEFGKYHFFIDFDGHIRDSEVSGALKEIDKINKVKIIGSYPKGKVV
jgi:prephenate dehydratase